MLTCMVICVCSVLRRVRGSVTVSGTDKVIDYFVIHCVIHNVVIHLAGVCLLHFGAPGIEV